MRSKKITFGFLIFVIVLSFFSCSQYPGVYEKPEDFRAGIIGSSSGSSYSRLIFSWNPVSGASEYTIYRMEGDKASVYEKATSSNYVIKKSYLTSDFDKVYAVQGSSGGKPSFMNQLTLGKNIYYSELNVNSRNRTLEWSKVGNISDYVIVNSSDLRKDDYMTKSAAEGYFTTLPSCSVSALSIEAAKYYAVYVYIDDCSRYLRMTRWYSGSELLSSTSTTTPGTTSPATTSPGSILPVNDLDFDKYTIGTSPYFHLTWSSVQNATTYKVYAAVVMESENASIMTDSQLTAASRWTSVGRSSNNSYDVYFNQVSSLLTKWQQLPNNDSCIVYFKVESYNSTYNLSGGLGKVCHFEIPKESYSYPCTYTIRDAASYSVKLRVLRIDSHTYKLLWDNTTAYYVIAYRDGGSSYTYWNSAVSSESAVRASTYQANSKYEFMLCSTLNEPATRVSNKVLCEF